MLLKGQQTNFRQGHVQELSQIAQRVVEKNQKRGQSGWAGRTFCILVFNSLIGNRIAEKAPFFSLSKWVLGKTGLIGLATITSRATAFLEMNGTFRTAPCIYCLKSHGFPRSPEIHPLSFRICHDFVFVA